MPIELTTPKVVKKPVVREEIVWFAVDAQALKAEITVNGYDEDGTVVESARSTVNLLDGQGSPRFDPAVYANVKTLLYQLASEDGLIGSGTIS